jgi:uncharacterized damage-inducible protein DinB
MVLSSKFNGGESHMNEAQPIISTIYDGWNAYQSKLTTALAPLTDVQLGLRVAPGLRSVEEIVTHMIGARARWFMIDEDTLELAEFGRWDRSDMPVRSAAELVEGLEATWRLMQGEIARWTPEEWQRTYPGDEPGDPPLITRQWIIWHLIEHDLHHGGEVSLTLGLHGYAAPDI